MSETIKLEIIGSVGKITLNRPNVFNSFNQEMSKACHEALDQCKNDQRVRAIYITGEGKAFCAGQDLAEAVDPNGPDIKRIVDEHYNPLIIRLRTIEKPIVAAVNGVAAGAGANVALAADIVVAKKSASFIQAFSSIGLIPDCGGTYVLPRLIGRQKAAAYMMLADKISGEEAERVGMIYKWFEDDVFEAESWKIAETLAARPTIGIGLTKRLLNMSLNTTLEDHLAAQGEIQTMAANTEDFREGVRAFMEKRAPIFKGA
ncbi:MAG: enoyl-CoA hydratase-related protein [Flavobacteriales bacterium]